MIQTISFFQFHQLPDQKLLNGKAVGGGEGNVGGGMAGGVVGGGNIGGGGGMFMGAVRKQTTGG